MRYILPGLGASSGMYANRWRSLEESIFLDWPKGFNGSTLTDLADHLICKYSISNADEVIGSSLGGMVACEISNQITLKRIVLIGSAKRKEEISTLL